MIKSSNDMVNANKNPDKIPGNISGKITFRNAYTGEAPKDPSYTTADFLAILYLCVAAGT